jgi:FkbH-like protein
VAPALFAQHNGPAYRTPTDLRVTPDPELRFLVVGACLAEAFPHFAARISPGYRGDFVLLNNFDELPAIPDGRAAEYDFQVVQVPLRSVLGNALFRLPDTLEAHERFLRETEARVARFLDAALRLNTERALPSYVLGFMVPQQNPLGRFQPRYDLRNVMHFIERLNMFVASYAAGRTNVHFVDTDQVSAGIGKRACQDDMVWSFTHGTTLSDGDHDHDLGRIQPPVPMQRHYGARWLEFFEALMNEVFAMHRTLGRLDPVKLVIVDLDDTLWRGVAAEGTLGVLEGWPMGFIETLLLLKRRGILLAVVSRNDEAFIRSRWDELVQGQIALPDFVSLRINFRTKVQNVREILSEVGLLAGSAVFIDDNPVERATVQYGVPGVRVLGSTPYYLKRILLWSPETQQASLTRESSTRTEKVRAQIARDDVRRGLSREEFLSTLKLRVVLTEVPSTRDLQMGRVLELLNKTNQFNTRGTRYTLEDCAQAFLAGRRLFVAEARDRFTDYGLIGAAWVGPGEIEHLVLSCRALGLGIEDAFVAFLSERILEEGAPWVGARLQETELNLACRGVYSRNGFTRDDADPSLWLRPAEPRLAMPSHLEASFRNLEPEESPLAVR